jgi:hypothetical protein
MEHQSTDDHVTPLSRKSNIIKTLSFVGVISAFLYIGELQLPNEINSASLAAIDSAVELETEDPVFAVQLSSWDTVAELPALSKVIHMLSCEPEVILSHLKLTESERALLEDPVLRAGAMLEIEVALQTFEERSTARHTAAIDIARSLVEAGVFETDDKHNCGRTDELTPVYTPEGWGSLALADYPTLNALTNEVRQIPNELHAAVTSRISHAAYAQ